jgi:hypothetical protein
VTGDDHNTDALIAALRSPALPAERAGEAAAVTALLGALARTPASMRFRAGRGIAIAVVTVASLGVGGLAAAGPGVFQAAASKARSFVTPDSADTSENAGAVNGGEPHSGSLPSDTSGADFSTGALASAVQQAAVGGDCSSVPCGVGTTPAGVVSPTAPPPECADGNHGDAIAELASGSVPPSAEEDHGTAVADAAQSPCTAQPDADGGNAGGEGGTNANQPEVTPGGPPSSMPAHEPATPPVTAPPVTAPPVTTPPRPPTGPPSSTPGSGNGQGSSNAGQGGQGTGGGQGTDDGQGAGGGQGTVGGQGGQAPDKGAGNGG